MAQLSALDAQFLNFETSTNLAHIAALTILDPSTAPSGVVTRDRLIALLERRLHLAPPFRRRLVTVPLGLDHPYWAQDRDVDFDYHVREIALPAPGDDHRLAEQVARLHAARLDRRRPLWELYLIHGLAAGRVALYTKVHHAAVDGVTGAEVLAALMDFAPPDFTGPGSHGEPTRTGGVERAPRTVEMLARGIARGLGNPVALLRFVAGAVPRLDEVPVIAQIPGAGLVSRFIRSVGAERLPDLPRMPVPRTPFSGPVSRHRRFAFGTLPLADVKQVKSAFGVTVNDVVLVLCAAALRRWLAKRDDLPRLPLVAGIPVSTRGRLPQQGPANEVTLAISPIPTQLADPEDRLRVVSQSMRLVKERFAVAPATWLLEFSQAMPAALNALAARSAFRLVARRAPAMNLLISNLPGPQVPLYICGARVVALYPISVITDVSGGINITVFSYDGQLHVGIVVDRDMVPDVWDLIDYLGDALAELVARTRPRGRRAKRTSGTEHRTKRGTAHHPSVNGRGGRADPVR